MILGAPVSNILFFLESLSSSIQSPNGLPVALRTISAHLTTSIHPFNSRSSSSSAVASAAAAASMMSYPRVPKVHVLAGDQLYPITEQWQFDRMRRLGVDMCDWDSINGRLLRYDPPAELPYEPAVASGLVRVFIDITNRPAVLPPGFWATEKILIGPSWGVPGWVPWFPTDPLFLSNERSLGGRPGKFDYMQWCGTCGKWLLGQFFFEHIGAREDSRTCNRCVMRRDLRNQVYDSRDAWIAAKQPMMMWLCPCEPGYDH
ncbi:hypothetical protein BDP81DRAFT_501945 [Colletotrichum phormii]|uniref:Uncharacterized protein n=1 Tax=Colletotrichum phormii TaxID=359342 RepID=A0AAI9ZGS1_9PEZI|nr:uncharacterized protein BDP81DRAFT_501945 [Colletotrichum phormii]KAK1624289.1 hypothetical protein BDP81DRAFT_501945 [Colletotrichum phormii]